MPITCGTANITQQSPVLTQKWGFILHCWVATSTCLVPIYADVPYHPTWQYTNLLHASQFWEQGQITMKLWQKYINKIFQFAWKKDLVHVRVVHHTCTKHSFEGHKILTKKTFVVAIIVRKTSGKLIFSLILADCNWNRTCNHLVHNGCGFESSCSHLNFRFCTCLEFSGNHRVWIYSETHTRHDKNIQSVILAGWKVP